MEQPRYYNRREVFFFWQMWYQKDIFLIHDLLDSNGNFLSLEDLERKYKINVNFLQYYQLISAIPKWLKDKACQIQEVDRDLLKSTDVYKLSLRKSFSCYPKCAVNIIMN